MRRKQRDHLRLPTEEQAYHKSAVAVREAAAAQTS